MTRRFKVIDTETGREGWLLRASDGDSSLDWMTGYVEEPDDGPTMRVDSVVVWADPEPGQP